MRLCRRFANGESSPVVGRWEKASDQGWDWFGERESDGDGVGEHVS